MAKHSFTQFGTFTVAILVSLFIFCLVMLFIPGIRDSGGVLIMGSVSAIMFICLLAFYKITITVDESNLTFSMGVGIIKKNYPLAEIQSCKPVKNSPLTGFGIRMLSNGWLYNVSGLGAIELAFKTKKSIVRIGTDKPELVSKTINEYIGQDHHGSETYENKGTRSFTHTAIFILVIAGVVFLLIFGSRETTIKATAGDFTINGMYGVTLKYSDIISLDTLQTMPGIKLRTNGFAFGNTLKGNFMLRDNSRAKLYLRKGNPPYINFKTKDLSVWINFKDPSRTREFYNQIKK